MDVRPLPALQHGQAAPAALWLLRHGNSEGNAADAAAHRDGLARLEVEARDADVPLTDLGHRQADAVGRWLADQPEDRRPTAVLVSPYRRAVQTAQGVLEGAGLDLPLASDERLRERDLGAFDGLTSRGIREELPGEFERRRRVGKMWYRPPGGESWADVLLRVRSMLATELPRYAGERLLVVSHQAVVMAFRMVLEGLDEARALAIDDDEPQANGALTRYRAADGGGLELEAYADTAPVETRGAPATEQPDAEEEATGADSARA